MQAYRTVAWLTATEHQHVPDPAPARLRTLAKGTSEGRAVVVR